MPAPGVVEEPDDCSLHDRIARLSPAELRELTATLTDDALGQLTVATIRQLKRRLMRAHRHGGKGQRSSLDRAAQQLVAEFSGQGDEDDF